MRLVQQRPAVAREPGPVGQAVGEQLLQFAQVVTEQAARARPVEPARQLAVRKPLRPVPAAGGPRRGDDRHDQVVGGVQGDGLRHQRARRRPGALRLPGDRHVVEGPQRQRHRQPVQLAVHREEPLHGTGAQRLQLVHRRGLRGHQGSGQLLRSQADAHLAEVVVPHPPFPHPAALGHHRPQLLRRGVQIQLSVPLPQCRSADRAPGLGQIAEVVPAYVGHLPLRTATVTDDLRDHHRGRGHQHQHTHDPHERMRVGRGEVEHHRRTHAERRQDLHQHALVLPSRQLRRTLQLQVFRGHFGRQGTRRALDDDLAHRSINPPLRTTVDPPGTPVATVVLRCGRSYLSALTQRAGRVTAAACASANRGAVKVSTTTATGFCRVTVVAPDSRIDVALPVDIAVADIYPEILRLTGQTQPVGTPTGYHLVRRDGRVLDGARTLADERVLDGEVLGLRPFAESLPPAVHDDVSDAVASAVVRDRHLWSEDLLRIAGLTGGALLLLLCGFVLWYADPVRHDMHGLPGVLAGGLGVLLTAFAGVRARVYADRAAAVAVGLGALPLLMIAGSGIVAPADGQGPGKLQFLLGCAVLLVASLVLVVLTPGGDAPFVAAGLLAAAGTLAAFVALLADASATEAASVCAPVALGLVAFLPGLSARFARLPIG